MGSDGRRAIPVRSRVRRIPADLVVVLALTLLTLGSVFHPVLRETPLRIVLGLPFVLFVPGYALVAALFPERGGDRTDEGGVSVVRRIGLSFAASLVVVASLGIVLNRTPLGIRIVPVVGSLSILVVGLAGVATLRRLALPAEERFRVPWRSRLAGLRSELAAPESRTDALLNVTLAVSVLVAASSVGYAIAVPTEGQSYTELYLLTGSEDGPVADDYPTEFTAGEPRSLVVGIHNREHETVSYTLLVGVHRVRLGNGTARVLETERLGRFRPRLRSGETWHRRHDVTPTMVGDRLRLTYLLYRGSPPSEPTVDNAYRELHVWVNVSSR